MKLRFNPVALFSRPLAFFAVEFSDAAVRLLLLKRTKQGIEAGAVGKRQLPAGTINQGEIFNKDVLAAELEALFRERKLKPRHVIGIVPEKNVFLQPIQIPAIAATKIDEFIELNTPASIPFRKEEALIRYRVLAVSAQKNIMDLLLVVGKKAVLAEYEQVLHKAGVEGVVLTSQSIALRPLAPEKGGALFVTVGGANTLLIVFENGVPKLASVQSLGLNRLEQIIKKSAKPAAPVPPQTPAGPTPPSPPPPTAADPSYEVYYAELAQEISRTVQYFGADRVGKIILAADPQILPAVGPVLTQKTGRPVTLFTTTAVLGKTAPPELLQPEWVFALGTEVTALGPPEADGLVSLSSTTREALEEQHTLRSVSGSLWLINTAAALVFVIGIGAFAAWLMVVGAQTSKKLEERRQSVQKSKEYQEAVGLEKKVTAANELMATVIATNEQRIGWSGIIAEIRMIAGAVNVRLTGVATEGGRTINLSGFSATRDSLLSLKERLEQSGKFETVNAPPSNFVQPRNINFSMTLTPKQEELKKVVQ